jgi:hypothetical protein
MLMPASASRPDHRKDMITVPRRLRLDPAVIAGLARRLTDRDRRVLDLLYEHKVLTTTQITQVAFSTDRYTRRRLTSLYRYRAVDRFRPFIPRGGSAPWHYVLDEAGALIVAQARGTTIQELPFRRDHMMDIALSPSLAHTVAVNGFFAALAATARRDPAGELTVWWTERQCRRAWPDGIRPDGYGRWRVTSGGAPRETDFFLEMDRGTETLARLAAKLDSYADLAGRTGYRTPVLFCLPGPGREQALRPLIAGAPVPVATTTAALAGLAGPAQPPGPSRETGPAGPVWLPAGARRRIRLADLAPQPGRSW